MKVIPEVRQPQRTILQLPKFFIIKNMSTITFLDIEFLTESLTT